MKLFPHQEEALNATENMNRVAYYHDMGLGKTYTGAEKMMRLGARVNLLICQKSKIEDWRQHLIANYPIAVFDLAKSLDAFLTAGNERVGIINYELAWRRPELLKLHDFTLMLDESSLIQNKTAKQTKFILRLQPSNVILLSGTPTSGKYENLWTQAHLLGWGISENLYQKTYVNWKLIDVGGIKHKVVDNNNPYKNVGRLKSKLRENGAVFLKTEDVLHLPEQIFTTVKCEQNKNYQKFMRDSIVETDDYLLVGDTTLTKRLYARQLCGQFCDSKLDAFRDLVQSTNDRLIVFYNFNQELSKLSFCTFGRPISIINGQTKDLEAYENESNSITFVQYQAGSMGLNLQKANKIIYFTLPERSELFEQSKKRIHRIGQTEHCFYYVLQCENTIEEDILTALEKRRDYTDELFKESEVKNEFREFGKSIAH